MSRSLWEEVNEIRADLAEWVGRFGDAMWCSIQEDALKAVAEQFGVDWRQGATFVVEELGQRLQRRNDVIRELRRQVRAQAATIESMRAPSVQPDPQPVPGSEIVEVDREWFMWAMGRL